MISTALSSTAAARKEKQDLCQLGNKAEKRGNSLGPRAFQGLPLREGEEWDSNILEIEKAPRGQGGA